VDGWDSFFGAQVSASAALAGLVFVGVSINLPKIMSNPGLPNCVLEAIIALVTVLIESSLLLVPGQPVALHGVAALLVGLVMGALTATVNRAVFREAALRPYHRRYVAHVVLSQLAMGAFVAAGVVMLLRGAGGVYVVVPGIIVCYVVALIDAWILLIEINR